jgi:hypothetical protein
MVDPTFSALLRILKAAPEGVLFLRLQAHLLAVASR